MGDPRKERNTSSCRRGKSFASFPVLVKSLFPGDDCESCYLQGLKQTFNQGCMELIDMVNISASGYKGGYV